MIVVHSEFCPSHFRTVHGRSGTYVRRLNEIDLSVTYLLPSEDNLYDPTKGENFSCDVELSE